MTSPMTRGDGGLPGDGGEELSFGEADRLEEREVVSASTDRRGEGERERDDGAGGESGGERRGRVPGVLVADDLRGLLDGRTSNVPPPRFWSASMSFVTVRAMRCRDARPAAAGTVRAELDHRDPHAVLERVGVEAGLLERGGSDVVRDDRAGAHRGVECSLVSDGRQRCGSDDPQTGGRDVRRGAAAAGCRSWR